MLRRILYLISTFIVGVTLPAHASSVVCSVASGSSTVFANLPDCSPLFTPTGVLDWGSPIEGSLTGPVGSNQYGLGAALSSTYPEQVGTTLNAGISGNYIQISSNDQLTRADNGELAWDSQFNAWMPASFVGAGQNYFAGNFGAASGPNSAAPYGDDLLGALAPSGNSQGMPTITLAFTQALQYVAFQVSSASQPNFNAELIAFDSNHNQIGTYMLQDTGDGGSTCAGLGITSGPTPCNTAPLIQFFDVQGRIASVELVMLTDLSGVYIDSLEVSSVPEPVSGGLTAAGLAILFWNARRRRLLNPSTATRG